MFSAHPIGFIHSPYRETSAIPKGPGAKHDAEGVIEILHEFEDGLTDIDGFSHLFILWQFDRVDGFDLITIRPQMKPSSRRTCHAVTSPAKHAGKRRRRRVLGRLRRPDLRRRRQDRCRGGRMDGRAARP